MLTHQIISRVQALVDDPTYWDDTKITAMINQAKDSIADHFGLQANGMVKMNSVISQRSYALPLDFIALEMLYWDNGNYLSKEHKVTYPSDVLRLTSTPTETGVPEMWYLWGKEDHQELWVWPTFDTVYEIEFWYWRRIPDVVNLNDEPMVPRDIHTKIVDYCLRQTWFSDELHNFTPERFDAWWEMELTKMQIAKNVQLASSDNIGPGDFNERMPTISDDNIGFNFRISGASDGTQW